MNAATHVSHHAMMQFQRAVSNAEVLEHSVLHAPTLRPLALMLFQIAVILRILKYTVKLSTDMIRLSSGFKEDRLTIMAKLQSGRLTRTEAIELARTYNDFAVRLYKLADSELEVVQDYQAKNPKLIAEWCDYLHYKHMARLHEAEGIRNEDFAETLALSASEAFTKAVEHELRDYA